MLGKSGLAMLKVHRHAHRGEPLWLPYVLMSVVLAAATAPCTALWVCQAPSQLGHAMAVFDQRCDADTAGTVVEDVFIGWYHEPQKVHGIKNLLQRTICFVYPVLPKAVVRCLRENLKKDVEENKAFDKTQRQVGKAFGKWQRKLARSIPSVRLQVVSFDEAGLLEDEPEKGYPIINDIMSRGQYEKFKGEVTSADDEYTSTPRFRKIERVLTMASVRQETWKPSNVVVVEFPDNLKFRRTYCCVRNSGSNREVSPRLPDSIGCLKADIQADEFRAMMMLDEDTYQSRKKDEAMPGLPCNDETFVPRYKPIKEVMSLSQYRQLFCWRKSRQSGAGSKAQCHASSALIFQGVREEDTGLARRFSVFETLVPVSPVREANRPKLADHPGCKSPEYKALNRVKPYRRSNNPFEGMVTGLRPMGKGRDKDNGVAAVVNEEVISMIHIANIGEDTSKAFVNPVMCKYASFFSAPDYSLRQNVLEDLAQQYALMPGFALITRIGTPLSNFRRKKNRNRLYASHGKNPTCREYARDVIELRNRMEIEYNEDKDTESTHLEWDEAIREEAMLAWKCDENMYGNGGMCDCTCGAWDPDCDPPKGDELTFENAPTLTSCPHESMRCGPLGCTTTPWEPLRRY